jgi:alpha-L-rhamnosidase
MRIRNFSKMASPSFWLPADSGLITYSAHVNALSVAYGIAPKAYQQNIMNYVVTQTDYELQPYFMFYVLQATRAVNDIRLGLNLVDRWKPAVDTSTGTLKENWQDVTSTGYGGDYSHAWAGAPLAYLSQNVLGIEPTDKPGNYSATLFYGNKLEWAKGKIPTYRKTDIEVSWKVISNGYEYLYNVPTGIKLEVKQPTDCKPCSLALNNKKLEAHNPIVLGPGKHRLVLEIQKTPSDNEK